MEVLKGLSVFSGIAIGKIRYYHGTGQTGQYRSNDVKKELKDFQEARASLMEGLERLVTGGTSMSEEERLCCREQARILEAEGSFSKAVESMISHEKVKAAYAVKNTGDELSGTFGSLSDPVIRRRIDNVKRLCGRLTGILGGVAPRIDLGSRPVILVAECLSPAEILEMDKGKLLAVITRDGSDVSHAAIMAKTMGIPAIVGIFPQDDWEGVYGIVDGYTGTLYLDPDEEIRKEYSLRQQADMEQREALQALSAQEDVTLDGRRIPIYANIGNLDDLNSVDYYGASGIGLLRSEFQYLGRGDYPSEDALFEAYKRVAEAMGNRIAVIRTADLGADKQSPYLEIPAETNPIMGNRGIRLCLDRREMFKTQLRAIYRASVYGNLAVMYPMISSEEEVDEIEEITAQVKADLSEKEIPYRDIPDGIMVETPAAVMISRELIRRVDFLSLGTNDLTQYTLAMDRQNPLLRDKYRDHHPAVMRMVKMVIDAAHQEGKRVCICGELAADVKLTETFLRMGVDSLSVVPACVLPVRRALRSVDLGGQNGDEKAVKTAKAGKG